MKPYGYSLKSVTPIFRIFDVEKAIAFYTGYLSFQVDWQHQFEENFPIYMQVSLNGCILHFSEHHGDCSPGAAIRVEIVGIEALYEELSTKQYKYAKPAIEVTPWNTKEMQVTDPFGNKINFYENM
ncbi:glyoxalase/bleomycin resistance/extradiol dioxygenase family protein [Lottiidibacillus patelloidae]|uniref:Bleomycin resistance protein n=1 Tax=Lottiidibacillus patelloidae TaxID=2670334 RepID=A0A263BWV4_9BACI|nr:glyoxalase superfamily protein [Lottiidibacillus patelloidae]OZM58223.1 glyoxalase/bleomycin resistance/extradiol dioxygenase family protein [Lottiidibacillus patelloidae]